MKYLKIFAIALLLIFLTSCTEDENYITSAVVNNEGHLVLTYSDGTTLDQGLVVPEVVDVEVFLVNFYNTEGHIISTQLVEQGEDAFAPTLNLPANVAFDEWDATFTNVTMDLNIHPLYYYETFTISFHGTDDPVPDITGIEHGDAVTLPDQEVEGKTFLGWYVSDSPYAPRINMYTEIHADMNLYAKYEDIVYTVTYHTNGGTEVMTQEALYGDMLVFPEMPIKEDYFYNGWYYDHEEMMPVEFDTMITEDKDIYISWIQFEYYFNDYYGYVDDEYFRINGVLGDHNYVHVPAMIDGYEVRSIGYNAFQYEPFYEVYLPETIVSLYEYSFADMPNLTSIFLPDSLESVGNGAFLNCENLTEFNLPPNLIGVGSRMFENTAIESVVIPEGYEYIGYAAFRDTPLSSITLPSSLEVIGGRSLANTLITELIVPEGVETIGGYAFKDCMNLITVSLPQSLQTIYDNPFTGALNLTSVTLHESNPNFEMIDDIIFNESMNRLEIYLPYKTDTTYQVPDTVLYFDRNAVISNPYLEVLQLPDTLYSYYPDDNFYDMESLSTFEVYDAPGTALIASNNGVLYSADFLTLYKYPMGRTDSAYAVNAATTIISTEAFLDNTHITSVILNNGIERVYSYAFKNCTNLSAINFPTTLQYLYDGVFYNVDGISTITLPNNIIHVGSQAFAEMDNLTSITLNEGLTYIRGRIIENSNNVTSLHIPSTVTSMYNDALVGSNGLTTVTIDASNLVLNVYNNSVYSEDWTTLYAVPGGLEQVNYYIRYGTLYVSANLGTNPYIKLIEVSSTVTYFNSNVRDLPNLEGIIFHNSSSVTQLQTLLFDVNIDEGFTLYIRSNMYNDYIANYNWSWYEEWFVPFN